MYLRILPLNPSLMLNIGTRFFSRKQTQQCQTLSVVLQMKNVAAVDDKRGEFNSMQAYDDIFSSLCNLAESMITFLSVIRSSDADNPIGTELLIDFLLYFQF